MIKFAIRSPGGRTAFTVYGAGHRDSETLGSPVQVGSLDPRRAVVCFDQVRHGWDGEMNPPEFEPEQRRLRQFKCPRCDGRSFEVVALFEYPDDLDELEPHERAHAEDFFTWFWLEGRCPACNWKGVMADVECA